MASDLERIEAKHAWNREPYTTEIGCWRCRQTPHPCDVVKLARALEEAANDRYGSQLAVRERWQRTLHEVAGGDDGE